ncbi:YihY/virulence factor BrkB family protein [Sphingobacterium sp. UT-1RO-CII-1]|uniref:YihY/virulence factor BrkB family protein n=1 Tax=Sphingobacterium sp. UT-1RO-CII-1 TaxID=2995225 RepID=UPI00227AC5D2|nr:YihY/virulence factor BrkB family protein [Sphingobacterium sp. UT-1RO-CII-1]MCY4780083.1 YihY/virulence factor BrkB family protein [Sphingobacterium sp. UT-1RO-CII-1]
MFKKIHTLLLQAKIYDNLIEWSKRTILPGFGSLPLYTVLTFFFREIARESLIHKASSLAYNFMLALFPGILFLFTLIPYIPVNNFQKKLMDIIQIALPHNAYEVLQTTLEDIIKNQNSGLLSMGFILATFFATNGMSTLMLSFNKASLSKEKRSWHKRRLVALALSFGIVAALIIGIGIFTATGLTISYLQKNIDFDLSWFWTFVIKLSRWVVLFGIYFITVSMLYKFGPSDSKKWKFLNAGASLATILAILTFSGFTYFINNFGAYNKLYGSIGTLIVVMIWMQLNSLILLIGFELNAAIALSKKSIKIIKPKIYNSFRHK